jgi:hypothetical protein
MILFKGEFWGMIGIIAMQTAMIWWVFYMASQIIGIYFMSYP